MSSFMEQERASSEYDENTGILMNIPIFSKVPLENLKVLAYICARVLFKPGEYVFQQGEVAEFAGFIIEGTATLTVTIDGVESTLREYGEGDFFGGLTLLSEVRNLFSMKAQSDLKCLAISREKFTDLLRHFPELANAIIRTNVAAIYEWEARFLGEYGGRHPELLSAAGVTLV